MQTQESEPPLSNDYLHYRIRAGDPKKRLRYLSSQEDPRRATAAPVNGSLLDEARLVAPQVNTESLQKDIYFFADGTVVFWGTLEEEEQRWLHEARDFGRDALENPIEEVL